LAAIPFKDGSGLTNILQDLELSGFITSYLPPPFDKKKKDALFRLTDCFSLFYLKFMQNLSPNETGRWESDVPLCLKNHEVGVLQILPAAPL
jgi:hypothetical protein